MHASHVLIRGHVFPYADKAPFVQSGSSIMGAVEYSESEDKSKCHECGTWVRGLGNHIRAHGLKRVDYNQRHGLSRKAALGSPEIRQKHRENAIAQAKAGSGLKSAKAKSKAGNRHAKQAGTPIWGRAYDSRNQRGQCAAQALFRIQTLASQLKHTPTERDLRSAGISRFAVTNVIGPWTKVLRILGLLPNAKFEGAKLIPENYPTVAEIKKRWSQRMPWPQEYFDAGEIGLERRSG